MSTRAAEDEEAGGLASPSLPCSPRAAQFLSVWTWDVVCEDYKGHKYEKAPEAPKVLRPSVLPEGGGKGPWGAGRLHAPKEGGIEKVWL